jgi:hypothetical protein
MLCKSKRKNDLKFIPYIFISNEIISHQIYGEMLSKCEHESKFSAFFLY